MASRMTMPRFATLLLCLLLGLGSALAAHPTPVPAMPAPARDWDRLVDDYYEAWFGLHPTYATALGLHEQDARVERFTPEALSARAFTLKAFLGLFTAFPSRPLSPRQRHDREVLISGLQGELLELEEVKGWEKNPDFYSSAVSDCVWRLMGRTFAPPEDRLRSVVAREREIPGLLQSGRANLKEPPRVFTEVALQQLPGLLAFFKEDVPAAFQDVKDAGLLAEFKAANGAALDALKAYQTFLKDDLLPRSTGTFALGAATYRKKLFLDEMVDVPLDRLLALGMADLRRNQAELKRIARRIDPKASVPEIMARAGRDHTTAGQLLKTFQDSLQGARSFLEQRQLLTIPPGPLPRVQETPPFMRALTQASMDTPGPFEVSKEAFFHVTLPDPAWSPAMADDYLGAFSRGMVPNLVVHEVFPGHYVQFLWVNATPASKVRKIAACGTNVEGWAHYAEQMMVEEGFTGKDPWLRIGQLQDALLRDARYVVAIRMHTRGMTLAQARAFFVEEGCQPETIADMETKRGTSDPMYLEYTLGKLEILKLRADYRKKMGARFSLKAFHDAFLACGPLPIRIIREEMLGTSGPVL